MNKMSRKAGFLLLLLAGLCAASVSAQSTNEEMLRRADTQFDLYAYNTALNTYNEVLKTDPNNAYAIGRKADCLFQLNRPAEAIPLYDRAVTLSRIEPDIVFRYAQALMQTGDYVGQKSTSPPMLRPIQQLVSTMPLCATTPKQPSRNAEPSL